MLGETQPHFGEDEGEEGDTRQTPQEIAMTNYEWMRDASPEELAEHAMKVATAVNSDIPTATFLIELARYKQDAGIPQTSDEYTDGI
jgi:hypothetical protein